MKTIEEIRRIALKNISSTNAKDRLACLSIIGPYAYGTATEDDIPNVIGVFYPTQNDIFLFRKEENISVSYDNVNVCLYSFENFISGLSKGNTDIIEMLNSEIAKKLFVDEHFKDFFCNFKNFYCDRSLFLSRKACDNYETYQINYNKFEADFHTRMLKEEKISENNIEQTKKIIFKHQLYTILYYEMLIDIYRDGTRYFQFGEYIGDYENSWKDILEGSLFNENKFDIAVYNLKNKLDLVKRNSNLPKDISQKSIDKLHIMVNKYVLFGDE